MSKSYQKPVAIDGHISSVSTLESWMLFPGADVNSAMLRYAYVKNAFLDKLEIGLDIYASNLRKLKTNGVEIEINESNTPKFIDLNPTTVLNNGFVLMRATDLHTLLIRPPSLANKIARKHFSDASLTGSLLLYMRLLDQGQNLPLASFRKSVEIAKLRDLPNRSKGHRSTESLEPRTKIVKGTAESAWEQFDTVSHLWAALHALRDPIGTPANNFLAGVPIPDLLAIAKLYQIWGTTFFSNVLNSALRKNKRFTFLTVTYEGGDFPKNNYDFSQLPLDDQAMEFVVKKYPPKN